MVLPGEAGGTGIQLLRHEPPAVFGKILFIIEIFGAHPLAVFIQRGGSKGQWSTNKRGHNPVFSIMLRFHSATALTGS